MPYRITHDGELGIIEVVFLGNITPEDLRASTSECIALHKRTGALGVLVDSNTWELGAPATQIYELPKEYLKDGLDPRIRIAVLLPTQPAAVEGARFYEDVCRNRGWNARVMPDRASALEWLGLPR